MKEKLNSSIQRVSLKQLRALAATVRSGTASGAAQALNITPPAVSLQLRLLEQNAGLPLLERSHEGLRVTQAGQELLATAERIEIALADCGEALRALISSDGGRASVGVVSTAKYFAPRALAEFAKSHPNVDIRLQVGNREETIAALGDHNLDFAVMGRPPIDYAVEKAVIGDHPHIIVAPIDHHLAGRKRLALKDLAQETFLLREKGSGTRLLMQRLFSDAGLSPNLGMEIGSNETIKQAVMAGLGIALISAHTVSAEIEYGRLAALPVKGLPIVRQWFVVRPQEKRLLPAAQALWDFFATSGAEHLPAVSTRKIARRR
ncbi:LysR family transcriptional regulator [Pelagibius litoralis]|uniref:HTH-type transcriptional regulator CbbR n=1 Tax=Pelagibius litoralis TaxID=374515 RepID=A0A967EWV3_9PROT|nr:LysR substrate-binding domain-containing protein [Pelagibius litoralis]NIA68538.1 LysR family transcriptional regulator [Pelagibius litoralis]